MATAFDLMMDAFVRGFLAPDSHPRLNGPPWLLIAWHVEQICLATRSEHWTTDVHNKTGEFYERYWKPFDERAGVFRWKGSQEK